MINSLLNKIKYWLTYHKHTYGHTSFTCLLTFYFFKDKIKWMSFIYAIKNQFPNFFLSTKISDSCCSPFNNPNKRSLLSFLECLSLMNGSRALRFKSSWRISLPKRKLQSILTFPARITKHYSLHEGERCTIVLKLIATFLPHHFALDWNEWLRILRIEEKYLSNTKYFENRKRMDLFV